jgi:hypothetical protein
MQKENKYIYMHAHESMAKEKKKKKMKNRKDSPCLLKNQNSRERVNSCSHGSLHLVSTYSTHIAHLDQSCMTSFSIGSSL